MTEVYNYTYDVFLEDITNIAWKYKGAAEFYGAADLVVSPSRGGLVPGVYLSHLLDIPFHPVVWDKTTKIPDLLVPKALSEGKRIIVMEDIIDSGETLKQLLQDWDYTLKGKLNSKQVQINALIHNIDVDVIYNNEKSVFLPAFAGLAISRKNGFSQWVQFPWETKL